MFYEGYDVNESLIASMSLYLKTRNTGIVLSSRKKGESKFKERSVEIKKETNNKYSLKSTKCK